MVSFSDFYFIDNFYAPVGCAYGLGLGKNEIHKPLECLEKEILDTQGSRGAVI